MAEAFGTPHGGRPCAGSVPEVELEVVKTNLGPRSGVAMMEFIWVALIDVIVAFTDVTASTFVAGDPELKGLHFDFNPGGAVAMASTLYLSLSVVMGLAASLLTTGSKALLERPAAPVQPCNDTRAPEPTSSRGRLPRLRYTGAISRSGPHP